MGTRVKGQLLEHSIFLSPCHMEITGMLGAQAKERHKCVYYA